MSSPDWDNTGDIITVKDLYPIGSILILDHPLENVTTWDIDAPDGTLENPVLTVEWKGMIWEYLNDYKDVALGQPAHSNQHILQNQKLYTTLLHDPHDHFHFILDPDSDEPGKRHSFNHSNTHLLTKEEMPAHYHSRWYDFYQCGAELQGYGLLRGADSFVNSVLIGTNNIGNTGWAGGLNGVTQPHTNMQESYRVYMYRRIA